MRALRSRRLRSILLCGLLSASGLHAAALRVGIEPVADRLSRVTATGEKEGFAVDIARAVARDQNLEIELVAKPWTELLEDFRTHRLDILAAVVATPERDALQATACQDCGAEQQARHGRAAGRGDQGTPFEYQARLAAGGGGRALRRLISRSLCVSASAQAAALLVD